MEQTKIEKNAWKAFSAAIGAEWRESNSIVGVSGLEHEVQAIAVDEKNHRVIVVSSEANPRVAALMQVDIQGTFGAESQMKVLVARPTVIDLATISRQVCDKIGGEEINFTKITKTMDVASKVGMSPAKQFEKVFGSIFNPATLAYSKVKLPVLHEIQGVVQQLAFLDWEHIFEQAKKAENNKPGDLILSLNGLLKLDNMAIDRKFGVCPLPLYQFSEGDWELLLQGEKIEDIRQRLVSLGIYQYFFPPGDHLALGLVDRGVSRGALITSAIEQAPNYGHPIGTSEIVDAQVRTLEMVDALIERGLVAEGEFGLDLTADGVNLRSNVKYRPREGAVSKLISRVNVNVDGTKATETIAKIAKATIGA